jgi:hypothetical protein
MSESLKKALKDLFYQCEGKIDVFLNILEQLDIFVEGAELDIYFDIDDELIDYIESDIDNKFLTYLSNEMEQAIQKEEYEKAAHISEYMKCLNIEFNYE